MSTYTLDVTIVIHVPKWTRPLFRVGSKVIRRIIARRRERLGMGTRLGEGLVSRLQRSTPSNKRSARALFRPFQRQRDARVLKRRHRFIVIPNATVLLQVNGARVSTARAGTCR